jgi:RNA polymerase sigma-70 factor (ECF subfamily)
VSTPAEKPNPIDPVTAGLIRSKARQIVWRANLSPSDAEDIAQDLSIALLRRLPALDIERSPREPFIRLLLNNAAANILRGLVQQRRPISGLVEMPVDDPEAKLVALALDLQTVLDQLPKHLRELAELLKTCSIAEAATRLNIPRTTLNDWVRLIREQFEKAGLRDYLGTSSVT